MQSPSSFGTNSGPDLYTHTLARMRHTSTEENGCPGGGRKTLLRDCQGETRTLQRARHTVQRVHDGVVERMRQCPWHSNSSGGCRVDSCEFATLTFDSLFTVTSTLDFDSSLRHP